MKALIWITCIFINAFITTLLKEAGISGAIPAVILFGLMLWAARTLCKKWDLRKAKKQENIESSCVSYNNSKNNQFMGEDMLLKKENVPSMQENTEVNSVKENSEPVKVKQDIYTEEDVKKMRFCSRCGAIIDNDTRKCKGCGKQYMKKPRLTISFFVCILLLICLVCMVMAYSKQSKQVAYYKERYETTQETYNQKVERISELNNIIKKYEQYDSKIEMMDEFIVFIEDDGTNLYHKYECDKFVGEYFWAHNIDYAKGEGYRPCPKCQ